MCAASISRRIAKAGIVLVDHTNGAIRRIVGMQYNPDTLSRTLQVQSVTADGDRSEVFRLKGPPQETIKIEAEIDATDQLGLPGGDPTGESGIRPQLAALEMIVYPSSNQLFENNGLSQSGTLEIIPMEADLALFIWSKTRVLPIRLTEFSITEQAFDAALNPIRAKVSLGMRVLNVDDLGFANKGGSLFMAYHQQLERFAAMNKGIGLNLLGIGGI